MSDSLPASPDFPKEELERMATTLSVASRGGPIDSEFRKRVVTLRQAIEAYEALVADKKWLEDCIEALDEKLRVLSASHGTCACSYDRVDDMCMHHSPQLVKAHAALSAIQERAASAERRLAELTKGPYEAKPCRGHWHVRCGGSEIITDAGSVLDEVTAKDQAERMNANYSQSGEAMQHRAEAAECAVGFFASVIKSGESWSLECQNALDATRPSHSVRKDETDGR